MSKQPGCLHGCSHHLVWVYCFLGWDASNDHQWAPLHGFLPPQGLCNLHIPGQKAWGLVIRCRLEWHKLPGQSGRCFCLCSSPHSCCSRPAFMVSHRQESPQTGPVMLCMAPWWLLEDGFHWVWQGYFHLWGWYHDHEDISCESGEGLLARWQGWLETWEVHLLSPILQDPHICNDVLYLGETDVLGSRPHIIGWQKMVLSNEGVCWFVHMIVVNSLCPSCQFWPPQRRHAPSGKILCGLHGWGSVCAPPTKMASAHFWYATLSTPRHAWGLWIFVWWLGCWHQWGQEAVFHLRACWGGLLPTQEFLEVEF